MARPILAIGLVTILLTFIYRARVEAAERSERSALADAGAESYLGFVVQAGRRHVQRHRAASPPASPWPRTTATPRSAGPRLAGDVSVEWALAHHDDIEATARLRRQLRSLGKVSSTAPELDEETADVAHAVVSHLTRLRHVGTGGESFPLILDDPFTDVPSSTSSRCSSCSPAAAAHRRSSC